MAVGRSRALATSRSLRCARVGCGGSRSRASTRCARARATPRAAPLASRPELGLAVGPLEFPRYLDRPGARDARRREPARRRRRASLGRIAAQRHPARRRRRPRPPARHVARRDVPDRAALPGELPRAARRARVRARAPAATSCCACAGRSPRCRTARRSSSRSRASSSRSRRRRGTTWSPRRARRSARSRTRSRSGSRRCRSARAAMPDTSRRPARG